MNNLLSQILDLLGQLDAQHSRMEANVAESYARGKEDAKRELMEFLNGKTQPAVELRKPTPVIVRDRPVKPPGERQRAPKGSVVKFINRVLTSADQGLTPQEIQTYASDEYERMIKVASIRGDLRAGRNAGRYNEQRGQWFLVKDGGNGEAEG